MLFRLEIFLNLFPPSLSTLQMGSSQSSEQTKRPLPIEALADNADDNAISLDPPKDDQDDDLRTVGLDNYGNTCYINSVIQMFYHCTALRRRLAEIYETKKNDKNSSVLHQLAALFNTMSSQKASKAARIGPNDFVRFVKKENILFDNREQQDAHEFLLFVLNTIQEDEKKLFGLNDQELGPIQRIFQGEVAYSTFCLDCETRSGSRQTFLDLSIDAEQNHSLNSCMSRFWDTTLFTSDNKVLCSACCAMVCARRCVGLGKAPTKALIVQLKRFKYSEEGRNKLFGHIALPSEIGLQTSKQKTIPFRLKGFVVHQGSSMNAGHYYGVFRQGRQWRKYDDEAVSTLTEQQVLNFWGERSADDRVTATAYILLYERC